MQFECKGCLAMLPREAFRFHKKGYRVGKCRECERIYQRQWYKSKGEVGRKIKRDYMERLRAREPDAARQKHRAWYARHKERIQQKWREKHSRQFFWSRATRLRGITAGDLASLWRQQRGRCALTGRRLDRSAQIDHIVPRARGRDDSIKNLRWVCIEANLAKRDLSDEEFTTLCRDHLRLIGKRIAMCEDVMAELRREAA